MSHSRPALDVLAELRRGRVALELTDALAEVLAACADTGKPGTVTLKLTFKPKKTEDYESPQLEVIDQINVARPRRSVMPSRFFLTDDNNLTRTDPLQEEFKGIRDVSAPHTPIDEKKAN